MKKLFQYTFRILSVVLLLAAAPCFSAYATGETTENVPPVPDASLPENTPTESTPAAPGANPTQPNTPTEIITPPDALLPAAPETPAPDAAPDTSTDAEQEPFTVTEFSGTYYVATETDLNVRSGPSTSYIALGKLSPGQEIIVTGKTDNNWYRIQYTANKTGYVSAEYISDTPPIISTPNANEADNEVPAEITPSEENGPEGDPEDDMQETEEEPSTYVELSSPFIGSSVTIILALCIFVVVILIGLSVYSMFRHDRSAEEDDDLYEDNDLYEDDESYEDDSLHEDIDLYEDNGLYEDDEYYEDNSSSEDGNYYKDAGYYEGGNTLANTGIPEDDLYIEDLSAEDAYTEDSYPEAPYAADDTDVFDEDEYDN